MICCGACGLGRACVLVHQLGEQLLVEAAPVDADAHRLRVAHRRLDHLRELAIVLVALADVAGVDAVLRERLGAGRIVGQQPMAVVVEVADQRHVDAHPVELLADVRHRGGGFRRIDGDADELRSGERELLDLDRGADRVDRVGVGHRLHAHRRVAADRDDVRSPDDPRLARAARRRRRGHDQAVVGIQQPCHAPCGSRSTAPMLSPTSDAARAGAAATAAPARRHQCGLRS